MKPIPGKISNKEFKNMLRGRKKFVPKEVLDHMKKSAGLKRLLDEEYITEREALKTVQNLQDEGVMTEFKRPDQLYREAGIRQRDFDEEEKAAKLHTNVRLAIQSEIEDDAFELDRGLGRLKHDERSVLGKSVYQQLNEEQDARKEKVDDQVKKKEKFDNKGSNKSGKPELVNLPDMDIG